MSRRAGAAVAVSIGLVVAMWLAVAGWLSRDAVVAARPEPVVTPGVDYFTVTQNGEQIGFASSSVDTTDTGVQVSDYFLADLQTEGETHRAWARVVARLTRSLRLTDFVFLLGPEVGPLHASGTISGDSLLTLVVVAGGADEKPDTQLVRLPGPTLLPNLVPLAIARAGRPTVGRSFEFSVFDPMALAPTRATVRVVAESLFTVSTSARLDSGRRRWVPSDADTLRAWKIEGGLVSGWIDRRGRLVDGTLLNLVPLRRETYELAYTNWDDDTRRNGVRLSSNTDIQEISAIAASAPITNKRALPRLRVLLKHADLAGYDLEGARQSLTGDTLEIRRETREALRTSYTLPADSGRFGAALAAEPLVQSDDPAIRELAQRIAGSSAEPRVVAERINRWVHDSLDKKMSFSIPNALHVLRVRAGDCNEHTQLFVALARAVGLPARSVAGLAYVGGKFYYHAWPEVYLGDWVAADPTFGQFPADAAHLRFVIGGFKRQAELLKLIGTLEIDVLPTR